MVKLLGKLDYMDKIKHEDGMFGGKLAIYSKKGKCHLPFSGDKLAISSYVFRANFITTKAVDGITPQVMVIGSGKCPQKSPYFMFRKYLE